MFVPEAVTEKLAVLQAKVDSINSVASIAEGYATEAEEAGVRSADGTGY